MLNNKYLISSAIYNIGMMTQTFLSMHYIVTASKLSGSKELDMMQLFPTTFPSADHKYLLDGYDVNLGYIVMDNPTTGTGYFCCC